METSYLSTEIYLGKDVDKLYQEKREQFATSTASKEVIDNAIKELDSEYNTYKAKQRALKEAEAAMPDDIVT